MNSLEQEVLQIEAFCRQLYEAANPVVQKEAERALLGFAESPDCLQKCQMLLERGQSPYSIVLGLNTLVKLCSKQPMLPLLQRIEIKNFVLNFLYSNPKSLPYIMQAATKLFATIVKYGWYDREKDDFVFRNVIDDVSKFIQGSMEQSVVGVQLLTALTVEMCHAGGGESSRSLTTHIKTSSAYRDNQLYDIYKLSCTLLDGALKKLQSQNLDETQRSLFSSLLSLSLSCLSFDFIGTALDESDDSNTIQIPASWRTTFLDLEHLKLFFTLYATIPPAIAHLALGVLIQLASVRRSIFSNTERSKYLNTLIFGVRDILESHADTLVDPSCYHEFCRLLSRLKANFQLSELMESDNYSSFIQEVAKFTVMSIQHLQFSHNSLHYILSLWQRLVASMPYVKSSQPSHLDTYAPEVSRAMIVAHLDMVTHVINDGFEDPIEDIGLLQQQLDQFAIIVRCEYEKNCSFMVQLFDRSARLYDDLLRKQGGAENELLVEEERLAWLVYFIGAAVSGRIAYAASEESDAIDAQLICRVMRLMSYTDSRLNRRKSEKLELSLLQFFESFRKVYIGDQSPKGVYRVMKNELGIDDELMVMSIMIRKIVTNLKFWGNSDSVVSRSLQLLNDLSMGYSSIRRMVKLDEVQFLLKNHTSEHFSFLGANSTLGDLKCRTAFYASLTRLLIIELAEDEDKLDEFMRPIGVEFEELGRLMTHAGTAMFNEREAKLAAIGIARDLRGISSALLNRTSYILFFDWIYPKYLNVCQRVVEYWYSDPAVTTPMLKFMAELAQNRSQRIQFDISSPNGILLFKEISKMFTVYGTRMLTISDIPKQDLYPRKLKGVAVALTMFKYALMGNYCNFGVFLLYGDRTLDEALQVLIKLITSVSHSDLLEYPKLGQAYYSLLDVVSLNHIDFLINVDPPVFLYILTSISEGINSLETVVNSASCSSLDNIITALYREIQRRHKHPELAATENRSSVLRIYEVQPQLFQQLMTTILRIAMFEEGRNHWSLSRPLLGLVLLCDQHFQELQPRIIQSFPEDKRGQVANCFTILMDGVERNLSNKTRDRFTQNLSLFRRELNETQKGLDNSNPMLDWIAMREELDKFWLRLNSEFTGSGGAFVDFE
ncbi:exportin-7-like isoform X2 [Paramacrobiotus metropolitanus]|uniref:exportin-7-like isoform X2 n=1 Tax=Paramacrobiotus metropolitanus TaxID=2943436 RepID=UPI002445C06B|nr:exportin-7-like isoform X2 [Paramacrobiotus metropolitanus]